MKWHSVKEIPKHKKQTVPLILYVPRLKHSLGGQVIVMGEYHPLLKRFRPYGSHGMEDDVKAWMHLPDKPKRRRK